MFLLSAYSRGLVAFFFFFPLQFETVSWEVCVVHNVCIESLFQLKRLFASDVYLHVPEVNGNFHTNPILRTNSEFYPPYHWLLVNSHLQFVL